MFKVSNLVFRYDGVECKKVLNNISITMPEKGIVGFTGPSGAGKSTIIYTLAGLMVDKWTGSVSYNNYDYKKFSPDKLGELRKKNFGFVFQRHFLIPYLNVFDNVLSIVDSYEYSSVAQDYLDRLGICHTKDKMISELSGGEAQRVAIARALIHNPKVIFADEPTASLDKVNSKNVIELFKELGKEKLIIIVSHDDRIFMYFDELYKVMDGKIEKLK